MGNCESLTNVRSESPVTSGICDWEDVARLGAEHDVGVMGEQQAEHAGTPVQPEGGTVL